MAFFTTSTTLVGNITRDPELRYSKTGTAICNLGLAVNYRKKIGDDWEDDPSFFNITVFGDLAEHVEESIVKGTRVVVVGRLTQRTWEDDDGNKRSAVDIIADEVSPSLVWATAEVTRIQKEKVGGQAPPLDEESF